MPVLDNLIGRVPPVLRYVLAALVLCGLILAMILPRAALCWPYLTGGQPLQTAAEGIRQWTLPVIYIRPETFKLTYVPPGLQQALAEIRSLRQLRDGVGSQWPPEMLATLNARIASLEAQAGI